MRFAAIPVVLSFATVSAENFAQTPVEPLKAEVELGVLLTSGNNDSTALSSRIKINQDLTHWRTEYLAQALYKEDEVQDNEQVQSEESVVTAERYFLSAQAGYKLDKEQRALFVFGSYSEDKFSGYDYQAALAAGYSDRLFQSTNAFLDYSIGPGLSISRTEDSLDAGGGLVPGTTDKAAIVRVSAGYEYRFSDNAKFTQSLASDIAVEQDANSKSISISALTANLNESFAMKASLTITHNSEVPEDLENVDTITALTLVYSL